MGDFQIMYEAQKSDTCIVGFASMGDDCGGGIRPFEWAKTFEGLNVPIALMRDRHNVWYQRGVEGVGGVLDVAAYVRYLRETYTRVITVGISMGGYAALLFGALGEATDIIAMSPQTQLFDDSRWDGHWEKYVTPIVKYPVLMPVMADYQGRARIFVGGADPFYRRDMLHARAIKAESVTVISDADHSGVGPHLRDTGFFRELLAHATV